jgi:hypothetical protein
MRDTYGQDMGKLWATYGQPMGNLWASREQVESIN